MLPNDVKLIFNLIDKVDKYFVNGKNQSNFLRSKHHQKIAYSEKYAFYLKTRLL